MESRTDEAVAGGAARAGDGRGAGAPGSEASLLLTPGPTPVPDDVRDAGARPMVNHRGPEFAAVYRRVLRGLAEALGNDGPVVVYPGSGTGGFEAAVVNLFSPGDRVLVGVMGFFGERFADCAADHGLRVERLEVPWGEAIRPEAIAARLGEDARRPEGERIRGVLVTHNETSTGAALDLAATAAAVRQHGALLVVDSVSGAGGMPVRMREWGVDAALTASQKAFMVPPGLAILALGQRAEQAALRSRTPRHYWDVRPYLEGAEQAATPYTPAVSLFFALDAALARLSREGWENVFARHRRLAAGVRAAGRALGLPPLAADEVASPTVTALRLPEGLDGARLRADLSEREGVVVADGLGPLAGRVIRISHMGAVGEAELERGIAALARALARLGHACDGARALAAARAAWGG